MGRVEGKVAFITGAARGQRRSHAIRLAEEGADIIAVDVPGDYDTVGYPMGTDADLQQTVKAVEAGRDIVLEGPPGTSKTTLRRAITAEWGIPLLFRDARVLLLSDCVHNAGPDPRPFAARLPRLDVLLDAAGEHDLELGRELAPAGRGRLLRVRRHRDVAPALSRVFAA
jgi:NAD(P)-dependent dehydrogenase (short-subunit alcohol dehydrogenase family)